MATLHVGVHREAGSIHQIAADGAAGQCVIAGQSWLRCPAGPDPVRFRWAGDPAFALAGDVQVGPGERGVAFVWAAPGASAEQLALLEQVTAEHTREVFLRTGARPLPPPEPALVRRLFELTASPDADVRREATRGLMPYVRHSAADPLAPDAPSALPPGLIERLARDPDRRVRRRTAALLREMARTDPRFEVASRALERMLDDPNRGVRRIAMTAVTQHASGASALDAWEAALARVVRDDASGRAACTALARLRRELEPGEVDAEVAVARALAHHPERAWQVWAAWRDVVPFDAARARALLEQTVGLSMPLLRHWAAEEPAALAAVLRGWEPGPPHSRRFTVIAGWLRHDLLDPELAAVLGAVDTLSMPSGAPETE